ncbi:MAG: 4-hydroxybenzoate octaprenyltransferase [Alphaproteobacteria bacterium BRH_c36]|nr:MAG: 4-hydroxybenzoate octaprenyltransferase [Alphaproteobacteria bacterium BRH_c36]
MDTPPTDERARTSSHRFDDGTVADAARGNWVDTYAPPSVRPYLRLARADRPIGMWLLVFPCWWALLLAVIDSVGAAGHRGVLSTAAWYAVLFAIGAFVMRGAGCAYNDYVDRDFDAQVARTRSRPIPSGQVSPKAALVFVVSLSLFGLAVLVQFNSFTIALGITSLALVAVYPFMKRYTYWPQLVLGLTFNWGALVSWAAVHGELSASPVLLYAGCVAWTIAYDTIYAHQDKEDDLSLGLKSTAIRFGSETKMWLGGLYAAALVFWAGAVWLAGAPIAAYLAISGIAAHFAWQVSGLDMDDPDNCLTRFKANRWVGWLLTAGLLGDLVVVMAR